ncbi:hypothetical protein CHO01_20640 [Cellulomonas hominis]|uniref:ATP synthase F1 complex delta/epsilon subunit N-terminal domain-containing protein n=1 Tax=Cellulomonas hominis TaxID=156981 RepID=A0A511FGG7_9CELL|nr:F0F1 ATP synthase subunit epsilon [Cellulomonas hominis]GEL46948.1 hypothetical protein CHO01_20640 [Cellulomonas hominis]
MDVPLRPSTPGSPAVPSARPNPAPAPDGPALSVHVVAPDGVLWSGDAAIVSVPSASGSLGIMARHEPVAAALVAGPVRVRPLAGDVLELAITGGFVVTDDDEVTVLVDALAPPAPA